MTVDRFLTAPVNSPPLLLFYTDLGPRLGRIIRHDHGANVHLNMVDSTAPEWVPMSSLHPCEDPPARIIIHPAETLGYRYATSAGQSLCSLDNDGNVAVAWYPDANVEEI